MVHKLCQGCTCNTHTAYKEEKSAGLTKCLSWFMQPKNRAAFACTTYPHRQRERRAVQSIMGRTVSELEVMLRA